MKPRSLFLSVLLCGLTACAPQQAADAPALDLEEFARAEDAVSRFLGADGMLLDYADDDTRVFHTYAGLFVCQDSTDGWQLTRALDLAPLGANYTQGDNAAKVWADDVCAHIQTPDETYRYTYASGALDTVSDAAPPDQPEPDWSFGEEGSALTQQLTEETGQILSNPYPLDAENAAFVAVSPDVLALYASVYAPETGSWTLEPVLLT